MLRDDFGNQTHTVGVYAFFNGTVKHGNINMGEKFKTMLLAANME